MGGDEAGGETRAGAEALRGPCGGRALLKRGENTTTILKKKHTTLPESFSYDYVWRTIGRGVGSAALRTPGEARWAVQSSFHTFLWNAGRKIKQCE